MLDVCIGAPSRSCQSNGTFVRSLYQRPRGNIESGGHVDLALKRANLVFPVKRRDTYLLRQSTCELWSRKKAKLVSWTSGWWWVSMVNEELSDELTLKPNFERKANGQEKRYQVWRMWYSNNATSNIQQETYALPQPLALVTSRCKHLPCLCLPLLSGSVYLGNFYIEQFAPPMSFIIEPVSNTRWKLGKTKYKELSYPNPIVPSLIVESVKMSKRMMESSLLGPLSTT